MSGSIAPGARVVIRDAEWRVKRADMTSDGGQALTCDGLSELVLGREAIFLTELETSEGASGIRVLLPEETTLVPDTTRGYQASKLYIDTLLRQFVPNDEKVYVGQNAAMDQIPYQLDPARQALSQPRQRILIADSVGLGKTLSAGILTSELIARGRGKRILVLATKAMLSQFQQEFFNRFTIPLVRLDSVGLQRVRNNIPANHNPFHYYDRSIISIDTLKQDAQYRHYLEKAYWDIIIIDEAHNVAERQNKSQRARLASLLAKRSDTLMMLSATPHDGKPESFASLVNMLDPTAIVDPSNYQSEDFRDKGLVIRRFKKDVADQLDKSFPARDIQTVRVPASPAEELLYETLAAATFRTLDGRGAGQLFRTTLEKILLSSPAALCSTVAKRIATLERVADRPGIEEDIAQLREIETLARRITPKDFSKFQRLVEMLSPTGKHSEGWNLRAADDRMVIFTESVVTLNVLAEHLPAALKLKPAQFAVLHGTMQDKDIAATVESFNRREDPVRLLLCSDVASEGINLHYLSHRMIHFDIPWSLMLFQQRNGRIDRYGQSQQPLIRYLQVDSRVEKLRGDARILDVLIEKDRQASLNIGDPSEFMGGVSEEEQEELTAEYMESNDAFSFESFLEGFQSEANDRLEAFTPTNQTTRDLRDLVGKLPRIFANDEAYMRAALSWLSEMKVVKDYEVTDEHYVRFSAPADLVARTRYLPREAVPEGYRFTLTANKQLIFNEMRRSRDEASGWPETQYLWQLHPAFEWASDRALNAFGRHAAPVMTLRAIQEPGHAWILVHGGFPNRRGQFVIQEWRAFLVDGQRRVLDALTLEEFLQRFPMDVLVNPARPYDPAPLQPLLAPAIREMKSVLAKSRTAFESGSDVSIGARMAALEALKKRHVDALESKLQGMPPALRESRRKDGLATVDATFNDYFDWLENTQITESTPYIQIAAVLTGESA